MFFHDRNVKIFSETNVRMACCWEAGGKQDSKRVVDRDFPALETGARA